MGKIQFLVMDVDGTLTDGKIYMGQNGEVVKAFSVKDGYGIAQMLPKIGVIPVIITARNSEIVKNRCRELGVTEIYQESKDKLDTLNVVLKKYDTKLDAVSYIGDDFPDMPCMHEIKNAGGLVMCPKDAISEIREISDYVSTLRAGDGAVRECIEYLMKY